MAERKCVPTVDHAPVNGVSTATPISTGSGIKRPIAKRKRGRPTGSTKPRKKLSGGVGAILERVFQGDELNEDELTKRLLNITRETERQGNDHDQENTTPWPAKKLLIDDDAGGAIGNSTYSGDGSIEKYFKHGEYIDESTIR
jgi:hypothetical protein